MGHYLSDFETDREFYIRTTLQPMYDEWKTYKQEVKRGIMHTSSWREKMAVSEAKLEEEGFLR